MIGKLLYFCRQNSVFFDISPVKRRKKDDRDICVVVPGIYIEAEENLP
jgi:hypothetical protein